MRQLQHGDVLLQEVKELPKGIVQKDRENGLVILAKGEAIGHHHAIAAKYASLYELKGELYLEVNAPVIIEHAEHKPMNVPTGIYKVGQVREYDYLKDMERKVID